MQITQPATTCSGLWQSNKQIVCVIPNKCNPSDNSAFGIIKRPLFWFRCFYNVTPFTRRLVYSMDYIALFIVEKLSRFCVGFAFSYESTKCNIQGESHINGCFWVRGP